MIFNNCIWCHRFFLRATTNMRWRWRQCGQPIQSSFDCFGNATVAEIKFQLPRNMPADWFPHVSGRHGCSFDIFSYPYGSLMALEAIPANPLALSFPILLPSLQLVARWHVERIVRWFRAISFTFQEGQARLSWCPTKAGIHCGSRLDEWGYIPCLAFISIQFISWWAIA